MYNQYKTINGIQCSQKYKFTKQSYSQQMSGADSELQDRWPEILNLNVLHPPKKETKNHDMISGCMKNVDM